MKMKNKKQIRTKIKFRLGDMVKVVSGKDKGKTGKIEKIFTCQNKVLVSGVNLYKKHLKPQGENKPGGIVDITKPLQICKLVLVCPQCQQSTRIGFMFDKQNKKLRICKKCKQPLK